MVLSAVAIVAEEDTHVSVRAERGVVAGGRCSGHQLQSGTADCARGDRADGGELRYPAIGDARRIKQVLLNLIGNAIKFTDSGEVAVHVALDQDDLKVSVSDTGPGISAAHQTKIFNEFQQADSSARREKGGTGLGLAIVKRIIELHGGTVGVESTLGHGSVFWITLPTSIEQQVGGP